jgi:putative thioredoxin
MTDITLENFKQDLIEASLTQPVLVDIWAPWCAPCKALAPVLERIEQHYEGRFVLVKLNADEVPELSGQLSQMFGVRSIPFCVLFKEGRPVDGFVGALPEEQICEFLDKHVHAADELTAQHDLAEAEAALNEGSVEDALNKLREAIHLDRNNTEARFDLINLLIQVGLLEEARALYQEVAQRVEQPGGDARLAALGHCLTACEKSIDARDLDTLTLHITEQPRDFEARFEQAQIYFSQGDFTAALDALLEIIYRNKTWNEGLARKTYVAILELMTPAHPKNATPQAKTNSVIDLKPSTAHNDPVLAEVQTYRRKLSMALN